VDGTKNPARFPNDFLAFPFLRHICLDGRRLPSGPLNFSRDCLDFAIRAGRYDDTGALLGKSVRDCPADSPAPARDDRNSFL
jgi:hypothetical protein